MNKHRVLISILFCFILVAAISTTVFAAGTTFYSINIGYGTASIERGQNPDETHLWSAHHYEYTTFPYSMMSQIGATVWTISGKCGTTIMYSRQFLNQYESWMLQPNARSYQDTPIYVNDYKCSTGLLSSRRNQVVHYWQSSQYPYPYGSTNQDTLSYDHAPSFPDVPISHWAYPYIEAVYQIGIIDIVPILHNCTINGFCPNQAITRGEMAYFLEYGIRGDNYFFQQGNGTTFSDVPQSYENTWFGYPWSNVVGMTERLYSDGITGGCYLNPLRYCPDGNVTRAQMAVFLLRAEHGSGYNPPAVSNTSFSDVPGSYWAAAWIQQLYNEGITGGCYLNPLRYCPESPVTRAEMAVFLKRIFAP